VKCKQNVHKLSSIHATKVSSNPTVILNHTSTMTDNTMMDGRILWAIPGGSEHMQTVCTRIALFSAPAREPGNEARPKGETCVA